METEVTLILSHCDDIPEAKEYIGVDKGAYLLAKQNKHMILAMGDFDSVTDEQLDIIKQYAKQVIQLNPIKDDTDSQAAIEYAIEQGYTKIHVYGGLGGRYDHMLINFCLALRYPQCVYLYDKQNYIYALSEGVHEINKQNYQYISFFADEAIISLHGMKYNLENRYISNQDTYTSSNEILAKLGSIEIIRGKVLVIQSNDK